MAVETLYFFFIAPKHRLLKVCDSLQLWFKIVLDIQRRTQLHQVYNFLSEGWINDLTACLAFIWRSDVRRAIHVGGAENGLINMTVNEQLKGEFLSSAKEKYEVLMEHYRVLVYW